MRYYPNWLAHHGRKGQRWYVKNGPPYPLNSVGNAKFKINNDFTELGKRSKARIVNNKDGSKTFKKGFIFNRYDKNREKNPNADDALYVTYGPEDLARYMKEFGGTLVKDIFRGKRYVQHLEATESIKVPSMEQMIVETAKFVSSFDKPLSKLYSEDNVEAMPSIPGGAPISNEFVKSQALMAKNDPNSEASFEFAYWFSHPLGANPSWAKEYYDHFRKAGFDAVLDVNDIYEGYGEAPMIVFNTDKVKLNESVVMTHDLRKKGKEFLETIDYFDYDEILKRFNIREAQIDFGTF